MSALVSLLLPPPRSAELPIFQFSFPIARSAGVADNTDNRGIFDHHLSGYGADIGRFLKSIIAYCNSTRDYMVPSVWGVVPKGEDPYAPQQNGGCCLVM